MRQKYRIEYKDGSRQIFLDGEEFSLMNDVVVKPYEN